MKHFSIQLYALSPLAIRSDHAPGGATTAKYISGTTLSGSLASVHRLLRPKETEEFEQLFLNGQVHYPNLYPAVFKDEGMQGSGFPVYPFPKTAQSCKRFSGFHYKFAGERKDDEPRHGVRDTLIDWAMFKLIGKRDGLFDSEEGQNGGNRKKSMAALEALRQQKYCSDTSGGKLCGETMDHFEGYYRREPSPPYHMILAHTDTRLQTHTGINRETGTVQESILYSREVLEENMQFWGMVKLPETLVSPFQVFVEKASEEKLVRVGTGRTRGLGKVSLAVEPIEDKQDRFSSFTERLGQFHEELQKRAKAFDLTDLDPFYFTLTLHSPVILYDELLRYYGTIDAKILAKYIGLPVETFKQIHQVASTRRVAGWNELWGMPRTNQYAIETGSVFLFACPSEPNETLKRALFDLEEEGMGERRAEGFGRVCLSDPFHMEGDLR